jgi:hypothetical protein
MGRFRWYYLLPVGGFLLVIILDIARAFDDPSAYERQGYHRCDSPSGWCENRQEKEEPCGKQ